jgi:hypothetical protein
MAGVAAESVRVLAATKANTPIVAARWLERALQFSFLTHGLAMLTMAGLLLPGMPGGPNALTARMAYVAAHSWLWRLGWLPWQLTALSDLLLAVALLMTRWTRSLPALLALLVTLAALVPDQTGEALWITRGVALAQAGHVAAYGAFETRTFVWVAAGGGVGYTLAAIGWSWALARTGAWRRWLTWYSVMVWALFLALGIAPALPVTWRPAPLAVAAGNAVGFILLLVWVFAVGEVVMRRARPDETFGRSAPWHAPVPGPVGWALDLAANSRFVRAFGELVPVVAFRSDIRDVIYVNYIVAADRVEGLVPAGLELQRVGSDNQYALISFLTYRHGHFGPRLLGPVRHLMPSPIQTNWRIYVRDPRTRREGVYFLTTATDNVLVALGARLLAEAMPMHLLRHADVRPGPDDIYHLWLDAGSSGTAPTAEALLQHATETPASGPWSVSFASYRDMLAYCVPQDRALSMQPWYRRMTRQEIELGIPLEACEPLVGAIHSPTARALAGAAEPFTFRVPRVHFRLDRELHERV